MTPKDFPQANKTFGKGQEKYQPLPVLVNGSSIISCWELSEDDIKEVLRTKCVWVQQLTFGKPFQPLSVTAQVPFEIIPG